MRLSVFQILLASVHEVLGLNRAQGRSKATRWSTTPTLRGKDAEAVRYEIEHGTPDTPERIAFLKQADEIYAENERRTNGCRTPPK